MAKIRQLQTRKLHMTLQSKCVLAQTNNGREIAGLWGWKNFSGAADNLSKVLPTETKYLS
jgi:hypothetical protein